MTFNLRYRNEADGVNCFDFRREKILSVIEQEQPDVIGFQEATGAMQDWLSKSLSEYVVLGYGREKDFDGESNPIAFRRDRFLLHEFQQEWLSDEPQTPGSRWRDSDQSGCPRICCRATLWDRELQTRFVFFNTHTDHRGKQARLLECEQLMNLVRACGLPFVMTGDFNDFPSSAPITHILNTHEEMGTVDATREIAGTFHNFSMERIASGQMAKIDYVFTNLPTDPARAYAVADDDSCGHFYSDHNAVCAYVGLGRNND